MFAKMFAFFFLLCVSSVFTCREEREKGLLDCSRRHLQNLNVVSKGLSMFWVKTIDAGMNDINSVNFTFLAKTFPNLTAIDIRWNPFDCDIPKNMAFKVLSNCPSTPRSTVPTTVPSTTAPPTVNFVTVFSTVSTNINKKTMIISFVVSFGVLVLMFCGLYFFWRRKRRFVNVEQYALHSLSSSSSDETIIYENETSV